MDIHFSHVRFMFVDIRENSNKRIILFAMSNTCLLYTSDAADDMQCVDLGGRRIIKKNQH